MPELSFALIPAYALADSFAGGSLGQWAKRLDERLPGRAAFWGALLCGAVGYAVGGVWTASMALLWLIYRSPGWKVFGGSATPVSGREIVGTLLRHLIVMLGLVVVYWAGKPVLVGTILFGWYAATACGLAVVYGRMNRAAQEQGEALDERANRFLELIRGACFGLAVAIVL